MTSKVQTAGPVDGVGPPLVHLPHGRMPLANPKTQPSSEGLR
jgi:hypothetical protein